MNKAESNRLNALKSTGPKTAEGKTALSQNAVKHGAYSEAIAVLDEDPAAFESLRAGMVSSISPEGAMEERLVDRMASLWWRIERAGRAERQGLQVMLKQWSGTRNPTEDVFNSIISYAGAGWMDRIQRYEGQLERSFFRTMHELERIQAQRQDNQVVPPAVVDVTVHGGQE